jgi:energy-coupling factor transporter ATP-binding protein EcfA2
MKARIYEIKSSAAANAEVLRDEESDRFYWNDLKFRGFEVGDRIFFVNTYGGWAMYTTIGEKDIATTRTVDGQATFTHEGRTYNVPDSNDRFKRFIRFDVLQESPIEEGDEWTSLGSSEVNDLWRDGGEVDTTTARMERIQQLKDIFRDGEGARALEEIEGLLGSGNGLIPEVVAALASQEMKALAEEEVFHLQLGQDKLKEFEALQVDAALLEGITADIGNRGDRDFLEVHHSYPEGDMRHTVTRLIAEVIAYCDTNAAGKRDFNAYPEKRVVAQTGVRQTIWVYNLLEYAKAGFSLAAISAPSIRYALAYLKDPEHHASITSVGHRQLISEHLFREPFREEGFVESMKEFFRPYGVEVKAPSNLTRIMSMVLYADRVKDRWFGIAGLICVEGGSWFPGAVSDFRSKGRIALWWSEGPSYGQQTIKQLHEALRRDGYFELYYTRERKAHHRARVVDFAVEGNYAAKNWNQNGDVAQYQRSFSDYKAESPNGTAQKAKVVFLVDGFEPLDPPIPVGDFRFVRSERGLTQSNLLPFVSVEGAPEWGELPLASPTVPVMAALETLTFMHEHRDILCAIKTKPFILLAGISGTGKSRLVRTLAYQTCSPELQGKRPGNYALIMVKPNWHDPTELVGYVSRIGEKPRYVVTEFLRFLVKAWQHPRTPFFLCLDEMNLAPVEQYFADYLSVVETRRMNEAGEVITDPFLSVDHVEDAGVFRDALLAMGLEQDTELMDRFMRDGITLPANLVVMGTVNMDETTHSFSRKVLDRAMTFEMNHVDLRAGLGEQDVQWSYPAMPLSAELALGKITRGGDVPQSFTGAEEVLKWLEQLNSVLDGTPFKVAYRVRDEALIYAYHNSGLSNKPPEWLQLCLDEMMVMKVLSRIEGDAGRVGEVLGKLMDMVPENWKHSRKKIAEMQHKLTFGYTSFWS